MIRNILAWLVAHGFRRHPTTPDVVREKLALGEIRKILLVRPHQGLGDMLLASPLLRGLKSAYPAVELHFLADSYNRAAIERNPHLSRIWSWEKRLLYRPWALVRFIRSLRAERYGLAVVVFSRRLELFDRFL
jgi:ADP-heptose:LPS heptosyltransferase